ncbi:MAG TPA: DUF2884 family protein [Arenimonas sp.]|nr:DUF2884 family protein [Arenimonas sp.]
MHRLTVIRLSAALSVMAFASSGGVQAKEHQVDVGCNASSDYQVSLSGQAFVFENDQGRDTRVVLGGGKLFLNGKPAVLSAADQKRADAFEAELRQLVPESRQVAVEAVGMAVDALIEVSVALSGDEGKRGDYDKARTKALAAASDSKTLPIFNDDAMESIVDPIVAEFVPGITGSALGFAMNSVFAGEEKTKAMDARMDAMDKDLDARMEARAKALEPLAQSMCKRIQRMDAIDDSLEVRLPNGKPINFLESDKAR